MAIVTFSRARKSVYYREDISSHKGARHQVATSICRHRRALLDLGIPMTAPIAYTETHRRSDRPDGRLDAGATSVHVSASDPATDLTPCLSRPAV